MSHCSSCGGEDETTRFNEGYSSCCNKRICYGMRYSSGSKFGIPSNYVTACCWGEAIKKFGGEDKVPEGGYLIQDPVNWWSNRD